MCASKLHAGDEKFHPIYRHRFWFQFPIVQSLSHVLATLGDPMGGSFPVLHCLPEFAQIHVHWTRWCCLTMSSSDTPLLFGLQSFPVSGSFPMNWIFISGGQSIGVPVSVSVLPMSIQVDFLLGLSGLISLLSKGLSRTFSNTTVWKHPSFTSIRDYWKNHSFDYTDLCW